MCTHVSQIDVSYVSRCHSSRVAPFIGTSSPAVDTLLRCHVQPFCEPVALHNSSAAWKICPHKGTIIVHRREVALSERRPVFHSKPTVSNQWRNSRFQWSWRQKWSLFVHRKTAGIRDLFDMNTTIRQAFFWANLILQRSKTKTPGRPWSIFEVNFWGPYLQRQLGSNRLVTNIEFAFWGNKKCPKRTWSSRCEWWIKR